MSAGGGGSERERGGGGRRRRARAATTSEAAAAVGAAAQARGRRQVSVAEDRAWAGAAGWHLPSSPRPPKFPFGAGPGEGRDAPTPAGASVWGRARSGEVGARSRPLLAVAAAAPAVTVSPGWAPQGGRVLSPEGTRAGPGRGVLAVERWPFLERGSQSRPGPQAGKGWPFPSKGSSSLLFSRFWPSW